jgi:hypothetical protein
MRIAVELEPAQADRLREESERLGVPAADLARAAIADLLGNQDKQLAAAVERVLSKNHELYRRLA